MRPKHQLALFDYAAVTGTDAPLLERLALIRAASKDDKESLHGLHPWAAKFTPQLPREVIQAHTNERHVVLDPFCGSGTTLLEAARLGRKSIGVDSNPIATLVSRAKTTALTTQEVAEATALLSRVRETRPHSLPAAPVIMPRQDHWFQANVAAELAYLRALVRNCSSANLAAFLECVFSSIIVSVSNQESETRYAAIDKGLPDGATLDRFARKLEKSLAAWTSESEILKIRRNQPRVINDDASKLNELLAPASVDLIVTSPPYPNSYDYRTYARTI